MRGELGARIPVCTHAVLDEAVVQAFPARQEKNGDLHIHYRAPGPLPPKEEGRLQGQLRWIHPQLSAKSFQRRERLEVSVAGKVLAIQRDA